MATQQIDLDNNEFQNALKLLTYTNRSVFLTGKAGTGKSTFLRYITAHTKKKFVVLAPTGIAAVNVGGQTIHSFFKLPLKPLMPDDPDFAIHVLRKRMKYSSSHAKLIQKLELVIIDEISMVRADIIDFIDKILRVYSGNMRPPFGGKQMLFVGDVFQLEPVVTGDTRDIIGRFYTNPYFFNARVFNEFSLVPIELQKVYRQNEEELISMLDRIRVGNPLPSDIDTLNARVVLDNSQATNTKEMTMVIATRRDMVDNINETHLNQLKTKAHTYRGNIEGDFPLSSLPTDMELTLKDGAQVVFIKNDIDKRWVNGTIGVIDHCTNDKVMVKTEDGELHTVMPEKWGNVKYVYNEKKKNIDEIELGSFTQYPLKLAWALTIHKSQGLTFNSVVIDIGRGAFAGGQTYVALSRCRSLQGITMRSTVNPRDIYVNPAIVNFSRTFNNERLINDAVNATRADELYHAAVTAFDNGNIADAVSKYFEASSLRNEQGNAVVQRYIQRKLSVITKMQKRIAELEANEKVTATKLESIANDFVAMGHDFGAESWESDAAIANYDKAIDLVPEHFYAWLGKGKLLAECNRVDDALDALLHAAKIRPDDAETLIAIGDVSHATGDAYMALEHYLRAYHEDDKNIKLLERLKNLYEEIGDEDNADAYAAKIARLRKKRK
jgi:tetratricopeptide (TPR) repeat protein